jgi:hypothetical protein
VPGFAVAVSKVVEVCGATPVVEVGGQTPHFLQVGERRGVVAFSRLVTGDRHEQAQREVGFDLEAAPDVCQGG